MRSGAQAVRSERLQKDYAFIDQISPVRETDLVLALDALVFAEIQRLLAGEPSDLHLTIPEIIDPEATHDIGYFGPGFRPGAKTGHGELTIEDYIAELKVGKPAELKDMADIKSSQEIRVVVDGRATSSAASGFTTVSFLKPPTRARPMSCSRATGITSRTSSSRA
jgi:uncharacterized protein (TIGR04141 family)